MHNDYISLQICDAFRKLTIYFQRERHHSITASPAKTVLAPRSKSRWTTAPSVLEEDVEREGRGVLVEVLSELAVFELVAFTSTSVYLISVQFSHRLLHHGEKEGKKTLTQS